MIYSDKDLIEGIYKEQGEIITYLYNTYYSTVENFILQNDGTKTDAKEIFSNAIEKIYRDVKNNKGRLLILNKSFRHLLMKIIKSFWTLHKRKEQIKYTSIKENTYANLNDDFILKSEDVTIAIFHKYYYGLGGTCKKILQLYFNRQSYSEISEELNIKDIDQIKTRINKCLIKILNKSRNDSQYIPEV